MTETEAFLQAICENPGDDELRLIYADWLEERGDPHGEFIRLQCELARMAEDDPRRPIGQQRERWLVAEHPEWVGPELRELALAWTFRRGFVEDVTVSAPVYLEQAETLYRLAPINNVMLDLNGVVIPQAIIEFVPGYCAREYILLPLAVDYSTLTLAMRDPSDERSIETLKFILNRVINPLPAPAEQLIEAINRHYHGWDVATVDTSLSELVDVALEPVDPGVRLVNLILQEADHLGADRIRFQPFADHLRLAYRIGETWSERPHSPRLLLPQMVSRLRFMASIHGPVEGITHSGRAKLSLAGKRVDADVTIWQTAHGPSVEIALVPPSGSDQG